MDEEPRRPRPLTPMSGELTSQAGWTAPEPIDPRLKPKAEKAPPRTTREVILHGLLRLVVTLALIAGATALVALLFVYFRGSSAVRTFALAYIFVGAGLLALAFFHQTGQESEWYRDRTEHEMAFNWSTVYALFGVLLLAIGLALDYFL
jgi:hypothetical protein